MNNFDQVFQGRFNRSEIINEGMVIFGPSLNSELLIGLVIKKLSEEVDLLKKQIEQLRTKNE